MPAKSKGTATATPAAYSLTPERIAILTTEADALGTTLPAFPGRLAQRIRRSGEIRIAAERDSADLIRTPFHKAPPMTLAEIHGQRDRIEFLRDRESRFQALRTTQKAVFAEFEKAGGEAAAIKTRLLRTFDLFFAADPEGRQRVSDIRKGEGDPDLVQYALVMQTEARFRSAAAYWYEGTDKAKDYAAFVPPTKGSPADDSATDAAEPTVVTPPADA